MIAPIKKLPISIEAVKRLENRKRKSWLNLALASIAVSVTAGLNIAGGALLGFDLAQGSIVATVFGGIIGAVFEVGIVHGYLNGTKLSRLALVHFASAGALVLGMMHMASMSVSHSVATRQDRAIALAEIQELKGKLQQLTDYKKIASSKESAILILKNKVVKGGTVWSVSDGCLNDKHPKDCASLASLEYDLKTINEQKPNYDKTAIEGRINELTARFPESRLNQGKVESDGLDKSIFEKLRDAINPSMSINLLLLTTCSLVALVLQQILANVLSPFGVYKNRQKLESSGIKVESSEVEKLNQGIFKNFFSIGNLASKWADSYGKRKAELEYKSQRESEREADIANRAVWDVTTSLKTISPNNAAILLEKNSLLTGLKEEKKAQLLKATIWVIRKYEAGEDVKLRELAAEITMETNANFINYSFLQRTVQPAMMAIGLWENQGTENRSKIVWATEDNAVKAMRS
jgi:hypothetical protein